MIPRRRSHLSLQSPINDKLRVKLSCWPGLICQLNWINHNSKIRIKKRTVILRGPFMIRN